MSVLTKPVILYEGSYTKRDVDDLQTTYPIWQVHDIYKDQLAEQFEIENPNLKLSPDYDAQKLEFVTLHTGEHPEVLGSWVYFPWSGYLIHTVSEDVYYKLRTNRNQNLINHEEQTKIKNACVGVTGLSVGNSIAVGLAYMGVGAFKLAEFDTLETANLNRLRSGVQHVGSPKIDATLQQIYEINPYAQIECWDKGLSEADLHEFLEGKQPLDAVFDEIDDFEMKIRLRISAKQAKVPVFMLTSLGDNVLVDVERYDSENETTIFNGLLGELPEEILKQPIGEKEKIKYAMQIVGTEHIPTRALGSLLEINRSLVGRPQLYSTIAVEGGLGAYLVKRLILGADLPSGRGYMSFDTILNFSNPADNDRAGLLAKLESVIQ